MIPATICSETNRRIQQVTLSLRRLSQLVLPDMKRVTDEMIGGESAVAAASHEALMLEIHQVIGAAIKELGSIAKGHQSVGDVDENAPPKKPLSPEIEVESLRFCARVDLDKLQLVSGAKRALVDTLSDRLALHKIYGAYANHEVPRCRVVYQIQQPYSGVRAMVQDAFTSKQNIDRTEQVPFQPNPFRRMRNAFVGAVHFDYAGSMSRKFKALFSAFLRQQKGALRVGKVRLRSAASEETFNYFFAFATAHAECLVLDTYRPERSYSFGPVLSSATIRRSVKRIVVKAHSTRTLGRKRISALAELAMNSGDIRRIDVVLDDGGTFSDCLQKWIKAVTSQKAVTRTVNNALFHCVRNASMPEGLGEASARLPKGQWSTTMYTGDTLEFEDLMEKAVYVFENAAASKKITAVLARYQSNAAQSQPIVTCNFFLGADGLSDIGDFSEKHNEATGAKWYECVSY